MIKQSNNLSVHHQIFYLYLSVSPSLDLMSISLCTYLAICLSLLFLLCWWIIFNKFKKDGEEAKWILHLIKRGKITGTKQLYYFLHRGIFLEACHSHKTFNETFYSSITHGATTDRCSTWRQLTLYFLKKPRYRRQPHHANSPPSPNIRLHTS